MGRCDTAKASIGIKILLSDILLQINETNFDLIKEILNDGFIEDENDFFNEMYKNILDCDDVHHGNCNDVKEYLINEFKNNGSYIKTNKKVQESLYHGCLFDKELLFPIECILDTNRWGYERNGTNSISRAIDFDLSVNIEKYKIIDKIKVVFILSQHAG
jgi:hypothetical protein